MPPDLKLNSASSVIVRFSQSRSNPESNLVLGPGGIAWRGPQCGRTPGRHMPRLSFIYKRKKKICNKRQSRVRLGAFIPQRKDRCAHCQALGSYDRVSAEPQPQASRGHNGRVLLRARVSAPIRNKVCVAHTGPNSNGKFLCQDNWSEPTSGVSAVSVPRP